MMRSTQETRRWAFFNIGAMMRGQDTCRQHGPWSHPHTAQALDLIRDPYAHDHAQRVASVEFFHLAMPERWAQGYARNR